MIEQIFLSESRRLLVADYLPKIEKCLGKLSDNEVWWRPNEASNSIGNLLLHLNGNVRQWIIGGVGQNSVERDRAREFAEREHRAAAELLEGLKATVHEAGAVIAAQTAESLMTRRKIQDYDVTVLEAIYHVVEHFGMHTGQIIMLSKMQTGEDLSLWRAPTPGQPDSE